MSLRVLACFLFVIGFSIYAWRNWFASLCALVLLMAVLEHPDMPRSIGGIQGLNPWNVLMANVLLAWMRARNRVRDSTLVPETVVLALFGYLVVVFCSSVRLLVDPQDLSEFGTGFLVSEYFINSLKWLLPGFLFFEGCRNRTRVQIALFATLMVYALLAVQVIRWIPLRYAVASGADLSRVASRMITNEIGYNRVTLSMMLGGASWAIFCIRPLLQRRWQQIGALALSGVALLGQALTGGRSGYLAWGVVGFVICALRWRWVLLLLPILGIGVLSLLPGVRVRVLQGFGEQQGNVVVQDDEYEMTSGRNVAWPYVIAKINENPVFGFGREAMSRTGTTQRIADEFPGESFPHPHNAYLELLLDSGVVGFVPVISFFLLMVAKSVRLLVDRSDSLFTATGGAACALMLALLVASAGGQTFYAREGALGMWAAIGIMLRVSVERQRSRATGVPLFGSAQDEVQVVVPERARTLQPG